MNKTMKKIIFIIIVALQTVILSAQSSRPPWIMGEPPSWSAGQLPRIDLQGNVLRVVFTQDANPDTAQQKADNEIASYLIRRAGAHISSTDEISTVHESSTTSKGSRVKTTSSVNERYTNKIVVKGETFGRYCLLDKYVEYKNGRYYFGGLYLVAEKNMSLASVPPITYAMDRGAWRSCVMPGWAQFYTGRTGAGIVFLGTEAALVGTTIFFQNKVNINAQRINAASSIDVKEAYKQRYDNMVLYRNISAAASAAWYAYNVVDAFTSKKGKLQYTVAYGQNQFSLAPSPVLVPETGDMGMALALNIKF